MAAPKKEATRHIRAAMPEPTPRRLCLASLGMLVAARRVSKAVARRRPGAPQAEIPRLLPVPRRHPAQAGLFSGYWMPL